MDCRTCREALSARLDGEPEPMASRLVDAHRSGCPACRSWQAEATAVSRRLRVGPVMPGPDFTHLARELGARQESAADPTRGGPRARVSSPPDDSRAPEAGHAVA
ncbi:MAG TPA: zf-HC2 domain-containing protein [Kineosporiaceae bacterium]